MGSELPAETMIVDAGGRFAMPIGGHETAHHVAGQLEDRLRLCVWLQLSVALEGTSVVSNSIVRQSLS